MFERKYSIFIDAGAGSAYLKSVRHNLLLILSTASGRILLNSIRYDASRSGGLIKITPQDGPCNAEAAPATFAGNPASIVGFSPDDFADSGVCGKRSRERGLNGARLPNEVLFHELVHALRMVAEVNTSQALAGGLYKYDDFEEFCAILATNIYISDRTNRVKSSLRRSHQSGRELEGDLAGSFTFFRSGGNTFYWVQRFCKENTGFTKGLAGEKADFNPIAAYYHDPAKALEMSQTPLARQRDSAGHEQQADDYENRFLGELDEKATRTVPN
ncbi:MAG: hypothetical protein ACLPHP_22115 [Candidatus Sulfotelmatobacter sp.]